MGVSRAIGEAIANDIEKKVYPNMDTKKILQMIFRLLKKHKPIIAHQLDLRKALSLLNPAPDFEQYIQLLLREHDYTVTNNQIIHGKCVEHEIDAIATKNNITYIVEVKHHFKYHTPTSLDVSRISRAVFEDITEGHQIGLNNQKIDQAMIICNTKLSEHAKQYADCRGIKHIGWSSPKDHDLQTMIKEKKLYPITILKELNTQTRNKLTSKGILLLRQLIKIHPALLSRHTGISREELDSMISYSKAILSDR